MMWTLMRKELRLLRAPLIGAAVIAFVMYAIVLPGVAYAQYQPWRHDVMLDYVAAAGMYALVMSSVLSAVFGGATLPIERRERWADFAMMLPVSRWQRLLAKLSAGAALVACIGFGHILIVSVPLAWRAAHPLINTVGAPASDPRGALQIVLAMMAASLQMFGIAWLLGAFMRSPAIAASISIGVAIGGFIFAVQLASYLDLHEDIEMARYFASVAIIGAIALACGTIYLLGRVEP